MNKQVYVDGFVLSVKKDELAYYKKIATMMAKLCKEYGAISYVEAVEDDIEQSPKFPHAEFRKIAKTKEDEVVFFSYIVYPNKKTRTTANKKIEAEMVKMQKDPKMKDMKMPFDMKRMACGGFKSVVSF